MGEEVQSPGTAYSSASEQASVLRSSVPAGLGTAQAGGQAALGGSLHASTVPGSLSFASGASAAPATPGGAVPASVFTPPELAQTSPAGPPPSSGFPYTPPEFSLSTAPSFSSSHAPPAPTQVVSSASWETIRSPPEPPQLSTEPSLSSVQSLPGARGTSGGGGPAEEESLRKTFEREVLSAVQHLLEGPLLSSAAAVVSRPSLDGDIIGEPGGMAMVDSIIEYAEREVSRSALQLTAEKEGALDEVEADLHERAGEDWALVTSRGQPGKFFYHNRTTGETVWSRPDPLTHQLLGLITDTAALWQNQQELDPDGAGVDDANGNGRRRSWGKRRVSSVDVHTVLDVLEAARPEAERSHGPSPLALLVQETSPALLQAMDEAGLQAKDPSLAEPFFEEVKELLQRVHRLSSDPEVSWLLRDPFAEARYELSQLRALSKITQRLVLAPDAGATMDASRAHEISTMCQEILRVSRADAPASLPNLADRRRTVAKARNDLGAVQTELTSQLMQLGVAVGRRYNPEILARDLRKVQEAEQRLHQTCEARFQRIKALQGEAVALVDGYAARNHAVQELLNFALCCAVKNQVSLARAKAALAAAGSQEAMLKTRFQEDMDALRHMRESLATEQQEAERADKVLNALREWSNHLFKQMDSQFLHHASESVVDEHNAAFSAVLQENSTTVSQLRVSLEQFTSYIQRHVAGLNARLLEADTRNAVGSWKATAESVAKLAGHRDALLEQKREWEVCAHDLQDVIMDVDDRLSARMVHRSMSSSSGRLGVGGAR